MKNFAQNQDPTQNAFNSFLSNYAFIIAIAVAAIILVTVAVLLLLQFKRKNKKEDTKEISYSQNEIYEALGGKENVINHQRTGSRISLTLNDYNVIDENKLNELGVDSIIKMSNKITLIIKGDAESFYKLFD